MKKRIVFISVILVFLVGVIVWWNCNTTFLRSVNSEDISVINVRNGNTGNHFIIDNQSDINHIVSIIQEQSYRKSGISLGRMGTHFTLSFCDKNDNVISKFIVNSNDTIRKDPFFYKSLANNTDIIDFLTDIENK